MLNLTLNNKTNYNDKNYQNINRIKSSKFFPSSSREWKSSIFLYNKNNLDLIPATDLSAIKIIKSYFSLYNLEIEGKIRNKFLKRKRFKKSRILSFNKIYISNGEFKHTNNKVIINIYVFNRQNHTYYSLIKQIKTKLNLYLSYSKKLFFNRSKMLKQGILKSLSRQIRNKKISYKKVEIEKYCNKIIKNEMRKRLVYWYHRKIRFVNESKFTYIYLQYLKRQLSTLYNKQVEFNLINLKRFYLNSDILLESITNKIKKNRKKTLPYLTKIKNKIKVKTKNSYFHKYIVNNRLEKKVNLTKSSSNLSKFVIKNLKYRNVTGFRLEARGRLTKRYTASRSLLKVKYKGNLLNIDSSLKGLSSVLLKGNLNSNLQYTKLASKSRIGSFGIKGWISGN